MKILVVQNFELAPLGLLEESVKARGGELDIRVPNFQTDNLPLNSMGFDGLIILGGPMNAEDDAGYPHLVKAVDLIKQFVADDKPILGICLGAQILARAFGQRFYKHKVIEIGFTPVFLIDSVTTTDPLLRASPQRLHLMQWHFDTFELPREAILLMSGEVCQKQAYRIGNKIYGFQFHFEVTKEILQSWIEASKEFIEENYPDLPQQLARQVEEHIEESNAFCRNVCAAWLDLIETKDYAVTGI